MTTTTTIAVIVRASDIFRNGLSFSVRNENNKNKIFRPGEDRWGDDKGGENKDDREVTVRAAAHPAVIAVHV